MTTSDDMFARLAATVLWLAISLAVLTTAAVVMERVAAGIGQVRRRRLEAHYRPLIDRALAGEDTAQRALASCPRRHRLLVAALMIVPLVDDRDPGRIAATRRLVERMSLLHDAERLLVSRLWWRRAVAVRALGLLRVPTHAADVVAALDDRRAEVRAAALDALADLQEPSTIPAVVARLLDTSLHRSRRAAALAAFGAGAESLVLDFAGVDTEHRLAYAHALAICGSAEARPTLCRWAAEESPKVRAAALDALAHTGLDASATPVVLAALESPYVAVRAAAARALHGWTGPGVAARLGQHLDDEWPVATCAARALRALGLPGEEVLLLEAARPDLAGLLARQMLWRPEAEG